MGRFKAQTSVGHFCDFVINSGSQAFEIFGRTSGCFGHDGFHEKTNLSMKEGSLFCFVL
jgi:hypothetical protein